jgi:hypothetical protein
VYNAMSIWLRCAPGFEFASNDLARTDCNPFAQVASQELLDEGLPRGALVRLWPELAGIAAMERRDDSMASMWVFSTRVSSFLFKNLTLA